MTFEWSGAASLVVACQSSVSNRLVTALAADWLQAGTSDFACAGPVFGFPTLLFAVLGANSVSSRFCAVSQAALKAMRSQRTVLIVAHRLSTIADADVIFVMKDGCVAEQVNFTFPF